MIIGARRCSSGGSRWSSAVLVDGGSTTSGREEQPHVSHNGLVLLLLLQ
jgi:hypothetical protein